MRCHKTKTYPISPTVHSPVFALYEVLKHDGKEDAVNGTWYLICRYNTDMTELLNEDRRMLQIRVYNREK